MKKASFYGDRAVLFACICGGFFLLGHWSGRVSSTEMKCAPTKDSYSLISSTVVKNSITCHYRKA